MRKRTLIPFVAVALAAAGLLVISGRPLVAAKKGVTYELVRKVNLEDKAVLLMLEEGWNLGGVYPDCGEGAGEIPLAVNINRALMDSYQKLADRNKKEMLALLQQQFPQQADAKLKKITEGQDKLTNYGTAPSYENLQNEYDRLQRILSEVQETPTAKSVAKISDLVAKLDKFSKEGAVTDINGAKKAILTLNTIIEKKSEIIVSDDTSVTDNIERLEKIRRTVKSALERIDQLGGSGCRTTFVFYRAKT